MSRGGKRAGAGRPRKLVEQHLAEGTYRPGRHRRLIAPPLLPPPGRKRSPESRWKELVGDQHWRFSERQLALARRGPLEVLFTDDPDSAEAQTLQAAWREWDKRFGLHWRLQNECPRWVDREALAGEQHGPGADFELAEFVALVDQHRAEWDRSLPDPPGWDQLSRGGGSRTRPGDGGQLRVACGNCGARLIVLPAEVAAAVERQSLPDLRQALARVRDNGDFSFALADQNSHFPCPRCGEDQLLAA
jgi:hypothetical protein